MKKSFIKYFVPIVLITVFLLVVLKSAWICDDSFISFRYIKNLFNGDGLRWNVDERVQAYTSPLYTFLTVPLFFITNNMYLTAIILSVSMTLLAILIIFSFKEKNEVYALGLFIAILISSKAFIDYSTSGLENPVTFLLLAIFYKNYLKHGNQFEEKYFLKQCLLASLFLINRIDSIVFIIIPLVHIFFNKFSTKKILFGIIGIAPFLIWELFSLIYYGSFVPNTAIAKLNNANILSMNINVGYDYFKAIFLNHDIITLLVVFVGMTIWIIIPKQNKFKYLFASLGVVLYTCYIFYIGGDFMLGRFIAAPFFLSAIIIYCFTVNELEKEKMFMGTIYVAVIILFFGMFPKTSPITAKIKYDLNDSYTYTDLSYTHNKVNIMDERKWYYNDAGLYYYLGNTILTGYDNNRPITKYGYMGKEFDEDIVYVEGTVGFKGYFSPDDTIIIDIYGLCDPLISRIPAAANQRPGHYKRPVPDGYLETRETGINSISNPSLKLYYDKVKILVSEDLFSLKRFKTIIEMNIGKYDYLMDDYIASEEYARYLEAMNN